MAGRTQIRARPSFFDRLRGESVCRSTSSEVTNHLSKAFGAVIVAAVPEVDHGSVLTDPRGEGEFQLHIACPLITN